MDNAANLLEQHLSDEQVRLLRSASEFSYQSGVELFLVGGTVRDLLLGQTPLDVDITASRPPLDFDTRLAANLGGEVTARSQFGTSKLNAGGLEIDLAMTRKEVYEYPGALPTVEPGTLDDDLARRDFSINAMAVSLNRDSWGHIVDVFNGRDDLQKSVIRILHLKSFEDDATRILRGIRYAGRLGFGFDEKTETSLKQNLHFLDTISGDRVRHELERIFRESNAVAILRLAQDFGVLHAIFKPLNLEDAILDKTQEIAYESSSKINLVWASILAYSMTNPEVNGLIARINLNAGTAKVVRDTTTIRDILDRLTELDLPKSQIYELLSPFDRTALEAHARLTDKPMISQNIRLYLSELSGVRPTLNGDDLIRLGVPQGPRIGELLGEIRGAKLDGLIVSREDEEEFVRVRVQGEN